MVQDATVVPFVARLAPALSHVAPPVVVAVVLALFPSLGFARFAAESRVAVALAVVAHSVAVAVQRAGHLLFAGFAGISQITKALSVLADAAIPAVLRAWQGKNFLAGRAGESWVAVALSHQAKAELARGAGGIGPAAVVRAPVGVPPRLVFARAVDALEAGLAQALAAEADPVHAAAVGAVALLGGVSWGDLSGGHLLRAVISSPSRVAEAPSMEARAVRLAARRAGDHQVAGLARPARVAVACAEVAFAVPGTVLRARVLRTKAAVFSAEAWLAEAFADLAEAVAAALLGAHVLAEGNDFARGAAVPWFADALAVHAQAAVGALVRGARAGLFPLTEFTAEPGVAKAFLVEAEATKVAVLWALVGFRAVLAEEPGVALALSAAGAQAAVAADGRLQVRVPLRALWDHVAFARVALPVRVAEALSKAALPVEGAVVRAPFGAHGDLASLSGVAHLALALPADTKAAVAAIKRARDENVAGASAVRRLAVAAAVHAFPVAVAALRAGRGLLAVLTFEPWVAVAFSVAAVPVAGTLAGAARVLGAAVLPAEPGEAPAAPADALAVVRAVVGAANDDLARHAAEARLAVAQRALGGLGKAPAVVVALLGALELAGLPGEALLAGAQAGCLVAGAAPAALHVGVFVGRAALQLAGRPAERFLAHADAVVVTGRRPLPVLVALAAPVAHFGLVGVRAPELARAVRVREAGLARARAGGGVAGAVARAVLGAAAHVAPKSGEPFVALALLRAAHSVAAAGKHRSQPLRAARVDGAIVAAPALLAHALEAVVLDLFAHAVVGVRAVVCALGVVAKAAPDPGEPGVTLALSGLLVAQPVLGAALRAPLRRGPVPGACQRNELRAVGAPEALVAEALPSDADPVGAAVVQALPDGALVGLHDGVLLLAELAGEVAGARAAPVLVHPAVLAVAVADAVELQDVDLGHRPVARLAGAPGDEQRGVRGVWQRKGLSVAGRRGEVFRPVRDLRPGPLGDLELPDVLGALALGAAADNVHAVPDHEGRVAGAGARGDAVGGAVGNLELRPALGDGVVGEDGPGVLGGGPQVLPAEHQDLRLVPDGSVPVARARGGRAGLVVDLLPGEGFPVAGQDPRVGLGVALVPVGGRDAPVEHGRVAAVGDGQGRELAGGGGLAALGREGRGDDGAVLLEGDDGPVLGGGVGREAAEHDVVAGCPAGLRHPGAGEVLPLQGRCPRDGGLGPGLAGLHVEGVDVAEDRVAGVAPEDDELLAVAVLGHPQKAPGVPSVRRGVGRRRQHGPVRALAGGLGGADLYPFLGAFQANADLLEPPRVVFDRDRLQGRDVDAKPALVFHSYGDPQQCHRQAKEGIPPCGGTTTTTTTTIHIP